MKKETPTKVIGPNVPIPVVAMTVDFAAVQAKIRIYIRLLLGIWLLDCISTQWDED